jgi:hypothetical protein
MGDRVVQEVPDAVCDHGAEPGSIQTGEAPVDPHEPGAL